MEPGHHPRGTFRPDLPIILCLSVCVCVCVCVCICVACWILEWILGPPPSQEREREVLLTIKK
jgi:hypothetical protein